MDLPYELSTCIIDAAGILPKDTVLYLFWNIVGPLSVQKKFSGFWCWVGKAIQGYKTRAPVLNFSITKKNETDQRSTLSAVLEFAESPFRFRSRGPRGAVGTETKANRPPQAVTRL